MKYYAVAQGRKTGIFTSWPEAEQQVKGFAKAVYKSFNARQEAEAFLENPHLASRSHKARSGKARSLPAPEETYPADTIVVYTDGGAIGNPGPGGYGVVIKERRELSGGYKLTTNNRMELLAVIEALKLLQEEKKPIVLHSDSAYVMNGLNKGWARNWKKNHWIKSNGDPALNADLWAILLNLLPGLDICFQWVKGHAGNPLNERCDQLATQAARDSGLPDDSGYLKSLGSLPKSI